MIGIFVSDVSPLISILMINSSDATGEKKMSRLKHSTVHFSAEKKKFISILCLQRPQSLQSPLYIKQNATRAYNNQ